MAHISIGYLPSHLVYLREVREALNAGRRAHASTPTPVERSSTLPHLHLLGALVFIWLAEKQPQNGR